VDAILTELGLVILTEDERQILKGWYINGRWS
jgi:hypothetical protein